MQKLDEISWNWTRYAEIGRHILKPNLDARRLQCEENLSVQQFWGDFWSATILRWFCISRRTQISFSHSLSLLITHSNKGKLESWFSKVKKSWNEDKNCKYSSDVKLLKSTWRPTCVFRTLQELDSSLKFRTGRGNDWCGVWGTECYPNPRISLSVRHQKTPWLSTG